MQPKETSTSKIRDETGERGDGSHALSTSIFDLVSIFSDSFRSPTAARMDGYRTSRSESISSAASSAPASIDSPQLQQRPHASGSSFPNDDADGMSEEVRVAIAALGIMKRGGSATGVAGSSNSDSGPGAAGRAGERPDASRSASTNSNASYSWSASGPTDSTAASSPLAPASVVATESEAGDYDEPSPAGHHQQQHQQGEATDPRFIERVSQLPIVSGGLEWYGHAKASSRVVKVSRSHFASTRAVAEGCVPSLGALND